MLRENKVCWWLVLLILLQLFLSSNQYLIICIVFTGLLCIKYFHYLKYYIPKGFYFYLFWGILALIIGIINEYSTWRIMRATMYWANGIITIIFGITIVLSWAEKYDIFKSLIVTHLLITLYCFIDLVLSGGLSGYLALRTTLSVNIVGLEFIFPLYLVKKFVYKETIVSEKLDPIITAVFIIRIAISFSRTTIIGISVGIIVYFFIAGSDLRESANAVLKILMIVLAAVVILYIVSIKMPEGTFDFLSKFKTIFEEVEVSGTYDSYASALSNWRGYENQQAINQWMSYDIFDKLFGTGFGSLIYMKYISTDWSTMEFYSEGGIPILHNGYLNILCIGGIIGLFAYLRLLLKNLVYAGHQRHNNICFHSANDMIVLLIMMALNTYVIRGLYSTEVYLTWGVLFGNALYSIYNNGMENSSL